MVTKYKIVMSEYQAGVQLRTRESKKTSLARDQRRVERRLMRGLEKAVEADGFEPIEIQDYVFMVCENKEGIKRTYEIISSETTPTAHKASLS
ncbi:hypothetical protein HNV12_02375 [Methanococcoides sp. SA1]|nr:hypothetical protein [Methanococcoides sp. SA1]